MSRVFVNLDSFDSEKGMYSRISYDAAHSRGMLVNLKYGLASANPSRLNHESKAISSRVQQLMEQNNVAQGDSNNE